MDFTITLAGARAEIAREIEMRHKVYPRLIAERRMSPEQAEQRVAALRVALLVLERAEKIGADLTAGRAVTDLDMHVNAMASCKRVEGLDMELVQRLRAAPRPPAEEQGELL
jgi:hypothetical protein